MKKRLIHLTYFTKGRRNKRVHFRKSILIFYSLISHYFLNRALKNKKRSDFSVSLHLISKMASPPGFEPRSTT